MENQSSLKQTKQEEASSEILVVTPHDAAKDYFLNTIFKRRVYKWLPEFNSRIYEIDMFAYSARFEKKHVVVTKLYGVPIEERFSCKGLLKEIICDYAKLYQS